MTSNGQSCSCCTPEAEPGQSLANGCPQCGVHSNRSAQAVTQNALLKGIEQGLVTLPEYRICLSQACPVVYLDPESGAVFTKNQVSVRVGFKETDAPRPLCYCFDHSWESLQKERRATGQSTTIASIRESIQSAGRRCEEANPVGICCLADVAKALEQIQG